ncbi:hypothetical protein AM499_06780 [Bacillus sp. FJAT-22090]|uniref:hypothetical protein n=1 Tax=Bacillus sp. FJAT-22090 TaxID=1581038 RepID=UPI0006AFBE19|nr:hypothetical protein [Bacillus sp. FJAT-22090]ALC85556.1 hypothetical protein AM499_06780 [Bacillus sp. FJAT-22090]
MILKSKRIFYMLFLLLVVLLSGCNGNEKSVSNYYLSLMGESQTWNLTGYEVVITPESFKAGNGTLHVKNGNKSIADSFSFETHVVINDKDVVVHTGAVTSAGIDITEESTGAIEGGTYLNEDGTPITLTEINNIYMIVEWRGKSESAKERIDLYNKPNKEQTFLD